MAQVSSIQDLEKRLERVKRESKLFVGRLHEYIVPLKNCETNLEEKDLKSLAFVREVKRIEQKCKVLPAELDLLLKSPAVVISNASP